MKVDFTQREMFELKKLLKARISELARNIEFETRTGTRKFEEDYVALMSAQKDELIVLREKIERVYAES